MIKKLFLLKLFKGSFNIHSFPMSFKSSNIYLLSFHRFLEIRPVFLSKKIPHPFFPRKSSAALFSYRRRRRSVDFSRRCRGVQVRLPFWMIGIWDRSRTHWIFAICLAKWHQHFLLGWWQLKDFFSIFTPIYLGGR